MKGKILGGRYCIIKHLGGGGFGQTYLAEDKQLPGNPHCVVKQLKPQATDPSTLQEARRLFGTEAKVLYKLGNHPQIPQLLAHFEENKEFYLVQEFIPGHDLSQELPAGKQLDQSYVIALLRDILEVLTFVHQENVIHRDIKPQNIRRRQDGKIVLIDFGLVKQISTQLSNQQGITSLTVNVGTHGYMPSEQAQGRPKLSSDIYAVGMIGIQALTGIVPYRLPEDPKTGEIIWRDQAQVNSELGQILDKMVCYYFRDRYQSAAEALQAITGLITPVASAYQSKNVQDFLQRGDLLFELTRYEEAIACYEEAILIQPDYSEAWKNRALALNNLGREEEGIFCIKKAIELQPDDSEAWSLLGSVLFNLQRYEESLASCNKAIQLQSDDVDAWYFRGLALTCLESYSDAFASFNKVIQLQPEDARAWFDRGGVLNNLQRDEEAVASYDEAIRLQPNFDEAWDWRGLSLFNLERYSEALASYEKAIQLCPENEQAWNHRGEVLFKLQRYSEAIDSFNKAIQIRPDYQEAIENKKVALRKLKR